MGCFECGCSTQKGFMFCKSCFNKLKENNTITECDDCGNWYYSVGTCICTFKIIQCKKCGRWRDRREKCICELPLPKDDNRAYIKKTNVLSEAELLFKNKLDKVIDLTKYDINCQTSLRQLVERGTEKWKWSPELNRDLDFCIIRRDTYEVVLCIEYDDSTHDLPDRIERDKKVDKIAEDSGLKLIHIKRNDNMSVDYLKGKLENYL